MMEFLRAYDFWMDIYGPQVLLALGVWMAIGSTYWSVKRLAHRFVEWLYRID